MSHGCKSAELQSSHFNLASQNFCKLPDLSSVHITRVHGPCVGPCTRVVCGLQSFKKLNFVLSSVILGVRDRSQMEPTVVKDLICFCLKLVSSDKNEENLQPSCCWCLCVHVGVRAWSKLDCCEHSVARCMLSTAALKWSILILVSLGFACIIIGVILAVLQFTAGAQHDASSLVHAVILMGRFARSCVLSVY